MHFSCSVFCGRLGGSSVPRPEGLRGREVSRPVGLIPASELTEPVRTPSPGTMALASLLDAAPGAHRAVSGT